MKQKDVVKAYHTIEKFEDKDVPLKVSYALFKTKSLIKDQVDFQLKKEREIFEKYKPSALDDGALKFESNEQAQEFAVEFDSKINEVAEMDIDLGEYKKFKIPIDQLVDISVQDIEALEPFIEFVEPQTP